jgi:DivIVA domain-containing protein
MEAKEPPQEAPKSTGIRTRVPDEEIAELRDVHFSAAIRGYDRAEVDAYMNRVNQVLAELQITAAPESAIRHALDEVSEETRALVQGAHETADEITRRSRSQADDRVQRATQEAQELRDASEQEARQLRDAAAEEARQVREASEREAREIREAAEGRVRELEAEAQAAREKRDRLLEELRALALRLNEFVEGVRS